MAIKKEVQPGMATFDMYFIYKTSPIPPNAVKINPAAAISMRTIMVSKYKENELNPCTIRLVKFIFEVPA
jgi:hypothetical protein